VKLLRSSIAGAVIGKTVIAEMAARPLQKFDPEQNNGLLCKAPRGINLAKF
jgi:hypothetical protein